MSFPYSKIKTVITGELIIAADRNNEHENHINNNIPTSIDDYSSNTTQMQATVDPYPAGSPSLPTDDAGETARLRYMIAQITGEAYWYIDPSTIIVSNGKAGIGISPSYTFQVEKAVAGDVVAKIRNTSVTGYGLKIVPGADSSPYYALGISNTAETANNILLRGNGNIELAGQLISSLATGTAPLGITSTTVNNNLNADMVDDFHVGASVTEYSRGITTHIWNTTAATPGAFDLTDIGADWETIGPTGSGMTNIWTRLDALPDTAVAIIVKFNIRNPSTTVNMYARRYGSTAGIVDMTRMTDVQGGNYQMVIQYIPVSLRRFELYREGGAVNPNGFMSLIGWIE